MPKKDHEIVKWVKVDLALGKQVGDSAILVRYLPGNLIEQLFQLMRLKIALFAIAPSF